MYIPHVFQSIPDTNVHCKGIYLFPYLLSDSLRNMMRHPMTSEPGTCNVLAGTCWDIDSSTSWDVKGYWGPETVSSVLAGIQWDILGCEELRHVFKLGHHRMPWVVDSMNRRLAKDRQDSLWTFASTAAVVQQ